MTAHFKYYRKKMSSLEKDRHDLQSTIDALQEGNQTSTLFYHSSSDSHIF
jgi:hypothetical protein